MEEDKPTKNRVKKWDKTFKAVLRGGGSQENVTPLL